MAPQVTPLTHEQIAALKAAAEPPTPGAEDIAAAREIVTGWIKAQDEKKLCFYEWSAARNTLDIRIATALAAARTRSFAAGVEAALLADRAAAEGPGVEAQCWLDMRLDIETCPKHGGPMMACPMTAPQATLSLRAAVARLGAAGETA